MGRQREGPDLGGRRGGAMGRQRTVLRLVKYLAARDQHGNDDCDVSDGLSDSTHAEQGRTGDSAEAERAGGGDAGREQPVDRDRGSIRSRPAAPSQSLSRARADGARRHRYRGVAFDRGGRIAPRRKAAEVASAFRRKTRGVRLQPDYMDIETPTYVISAISASPRAPSSKWSPLVPPV